MTPPRLNTPETIGKRIARLRAERGWTQQALAARLAVSRVAVSHMEMDLTLPSERTITLLAGVLKMSPQVLVENTSYPLAKAEKLPATACAYTPLEMELALLENDLEWLKQLEASPDWLRHALGVRLKWRERLGAAWLDGLENAERLQAQQTLQRLEETCNRTAESKAVKTNR